MRCDGCRNCVRARIRRAAILLAAAALAGAALERRESGRFVAAARRRPERPRPRPGSPSRSIPPVGLAIAAAGLVACGSSRSSERSSCAVAWPVAARSTRAGASEGKSSMRSWRGSSASGPRSSSARSLEHGPTRVGLRRGRAAPLGDPPRGTARAKSAARAELVEALTGVQAQVEQRLAAWRHDLDRAQQAARRPARAAREAAAGADRGGRGAARRRGRAAEVGRRGAARRASRASRGAGAQRLSRQQRPPPPSSRHMRPSAGARCTRSGSG